MDTDTTPGGSSCGVRSPRSFFPQPTARRVPHSIGVRCEDIEVRPTTAMRPSRATDPRGKREGAEGASSWAMVGAMIKRVGIELLAGTSKRLLGLPRSNPRPQRGGCNPSGRAVTPTRSAGWGYGSEDLAGPCPDATHTGRAPVFLDRTKLGEQEPHPHAFSPPTGRRVACRRAHRGQGKPGGRLAGAKPTSSPRLTCLLAVGVRSEVVFRGRRLVNAHHSYPWRARSRLAPPPPSARVGTSHLLRRYRGSLPCTRILCRGALGVRGGL